jgi:plastocyanin
MKHLLYTLLATFCWTQASSQTELLLVGQTYGQMEMHDGEQLFTFGYTADYDTPMYVPGPTLHMIEGDSVIIDFHNSSMIPHTVHLHGLDVNQANDGVPQTSFSVTHQEHGFYHLRAPHPGTYLYHCHFLSSIHVQSGMYGLVIVHPASDPNLTWEGGYEFDNDFSFLTFEFDSDWHSFEILNQTMGEVTLPVFDPEYFMINGASEQQLADRSIGVYASINEVNHLRLANIGFCANRVAFPAELDARIIASDGRPFDEPLLADSIWVLPGERYDVLVDSEVPFSGEIIFDYVGMNNGELLNTQVIEVEIELAIGTNEVAIESLEVFPNPTSDRLSFQVPENDHMRLHYQVYNQAGKQCVSNKISASGGVCNIDVSALAQGSYTLVLSSESTYYHAQFVID